jgi:CDP-glycerol glycerophosphotransferase
MKDSKKFLDTIMLDIEESQDNLIVNQLKEDTTRTDLWYALAKKYESEENYVEAENAYKRLIERKEELDGNLYFSLGHVLAKQGKHQEASEAFKEQRVMQDAHGMTETAYNKDMGLKKVINYAEYYERYKIEENIVLYESYHGSSISCNPYAIFKSLLIDERFTEFKHIWVINDKDKIPQELKNNKNIIFIKKNCDGYMRYLAKVKYLINNTTFPDWYIRKESQIYLNTWHGTPMKTLGTDVNEDFMAHKNQTKNFLQASHIISPNTHTTNILFNSYDISDIFCGTMAEVGYPRQDLMLNNTEENKNNICIELDISVDNKVVLYAPTWRGSVDGAVFDTNKLIADIEKLQSVENTTILFRGHYMIEKILSELNLSITVVPTTIDTNTLLSIVDVLITDYSSICFDFMAMGKPILYYVYDREEYEIERGLYFPIEDLGGLICYTSDEVKKALDESIKNFKISKFQKDAQQTFCSHDNGKATKRVIDLIFFDQKQDNNIICSKEKESILLYGGPLLANGITTSFINLANSIDKMKYSVTIVIDYKAIATNELQMEQFNKFNNDIKVIPRVGRMLMTLEERDIIAKFNKDKNLYIEEQWAIYKKVHQREFKRVFGYGHFDYIVNFEGYTVFWSTLMGMRNNSVKSNCIYQHNDLHGEWTMKYPYLENTFNLYKFYDKIASVSKKTMEHNRDNLSDLFNIDKEKFIFIDNVQDSDNIIEKSKENIDAEDEFIFKGTKVFINIGRLSPEKGHIKLINAFYKISKIYPKARLVNLGIGVQENEIKTLIQDLKLKNKVFYLGQKFNPYSYLKKADCFILSSDHEGQPMTLLEAMILKKPIIATDIVGNRSVLEGRPGHLVENSEEGLVQGMQSFLQEQYKDDKIFDYKKYNKHALGMFYSKIAH